MAVRHMVVLTGICMVLAAEWNFRLSDWVQPQELINPLNSQRPSTIEENESDKQPSRQEHRRVYFVDSRRFEDIDLFSAAWLQPVDIFLKLNTSRIATCEGGSFAVFRQNRGRVRMTLDWFDFAVEHMSKWWKMVDVFEHAIPYKKIISSFDSYIRSIRIDESSSAMQHTIAVIAFQSWSNDMQPERGRHLTVFSLGATLASMLQAGFGRTVVVGYRDGDLEIVQDSFRLLVESGGAHFYPVAATRRDDSSITKIGSMEVGFAQATLDEVTSKFIKINMVKGALVGLQRALLNLIDVGRQNDFVGTNHNASYWRYVYLGEPDLILQSRPSALPQLKAALDEGNVLAPHRLQIVPHESDVLGMTDRRKFVPATGHFSYVFELNPLEGGVCCDENKGSFKPWKMHGDCGDRWFQCGFKARANHSRLVSYSLMRLRPGTGIVTIAAHNHGRRCFPSANGACLPPGVSENATHFFNTTNGASTLKSPEDVT